MAINWVEGVFQRSQAKLGDRLVLLAIAESADRETGACYPSIATIARITLLTERAVQMSLRRLVDLGELSIDYNRSQYLTNIYRLAEHLDSRHTPESASPPRKTFTPESASGRGVKNTTPQGVKNTTPKPLVEPLDRTVSGVIARDARVRVGAPNYTQEFEEFWSAYPTGHGTKKLAFAQWQRLSREDRARVMAGLGPWKESDRWQRGFIKAAELWIRDRLWEQEPPAAPRPIVHMNGRSHSAKPDFVEIARDLRAKEHKDPWD